MISVSAAVLGADSATALFSSAGSRAKSSVARSDASEIRSRVADVDSAALGGAASRGAGGQKLTLNLFDDAQFEASVSAKINEPGRVVLNGTITGVPYSQVSLAMSGDAMAGLIVVPGKGQFEISYAGNGLQRISQFDPGKMLPDSRGVIPAELAGKSLRAPPAAASRAAAQIDIMIVYTPAVLNNLGGLNAVNALIDLAVSDSNTVFTNSAVAAQYSLAYRGQINYSESGSANSDLSRLRNKNDGFAEEVHSLRDQYGADMVILLVDRLDACGIGYVMTSAGPEFESYAFAVVEKGCVKGHTVAHETGHNLGCGHDRPTGDAGLFSYSWGHRFTVDGTTYRTIMSYAPGERIPYYSNPNVLFHGAPTGLPESDPSSADNARTINFTAPITSNFRSSPTGNKPPSVSITAPADGTIFNAPANLTLSADASDTDGTVAKVEFFAGQLKLGEATAAPFSITYANAAAGTYTLTAIATDNGGATQTSAAVTVQVKSSTVVANDNFADRTVVNFFPARLNGTVVGATKEAGEPNHAGGLGGKSVWWSFTPAANTRLQFKVSGDSFEPLLAVYTGTTLTGLTEIAHDDGSHASQPKERVVTFLATGGAAYIIAIDTKDGNASALTLTINNDDGSRPANDDFAKSIPLSGSAVTTYGSNTGATAEAGEPSHAGVSKGVSVWWDWTAPSTGIVTISTNGSSFDTVLGVYTGASVSTLSEVASNDDASATQLHSIIEIVAQSGTTYRIAVDGFGEEGGTHDIQLKISVDGATPPNDNFSARRPLAGYVAVDFGINALATAEAGEPQHGGAGIGIGKSVWWEWRAPANGTVTISTAGSSYDTVLAVYTGSSVGALTPVASNDDENAAANPPILTSVLTFAVTANTFYQIAVDGTGQTTSGGIALYIDMSTTPANDNFSTALAVSGALVQTQYFNTGGTLETGEPQHAAVSGGKSVWWSWTAPAAGVAVVSTNGSTFDTVLGVYTGGSVSTLAEVVSNDDAADTVYTSTVRFTAAAGTTYFIAVDGYKGDYGGINLLIDQHAFPTVTIAAEDGSAAEAGTDKAVFTLTRTGSTASALTVYVNLGGEAINGTDFALVPLSVTIPAGSVSATIDITPVDDTFAEDAEDVTLSIGSDLSYLAGSAGSASATIADNDFLVLAILSGPTATPNPAQKGEDILFSCAASDPNATWLWDFGDGTTSTTGGSVTHSYSVAAIYIVTVTATPGGGGQSVSANLLVAVGGFNGLVAGSVVDVSCFKHTFTLSFAGKPDKIDFTLSNYTNFGYLTKLDLWNATDNVIIRPFAGEKQLDSIRIFSGKGTGNGTIRWNYRKGEVRYTLRFGDLIDALAPYGATNETTFGKLIQVPLAMVIEGVVYASSPKLFYKAKAGRTGSAR